MKVLSIDTSTMISSCSVSENGVILGEININQKKTHSETLIPMVQNMLSSLGMEVSEIDLYAVAKGPGSFTGLRIGLTTAKTLAQVYKKEIVGISTLKALAYSCMTKKKIIPLLDARGGRVYYGCYQWEEGQLEQRMSEDLIYIDELLEKLGQEDYLFVGEGARIHKDLICDQFDLAVEPLNSCIAKALCFLGMEEKSKNLLDDYHLLSPEYIRKSQAERDLEKKEKKIEDSSHGQ